MNERETAAGLAPTPGYRYAEVVGDRLFVAGQVPLDSAGKLVGESDPERQALQCFANLAVLLAVHGFDVKDIRQLTIHVLGHQADLAAVWETMREHFEGPTPPATLLGASSLGYPGQLVEIEAVIVRASS